MAKDKQPAAAAPAAGTQPGIQVVTQYIKDMSFENPYAPESLVAGWPAPETNVHISMGQKAVRENLYDCLLHIRIEAKKKDDGRACFILDLHYGALVMLQDIAPENHQPVLMVEVPKLLFPFAREIVATSTAQGGYPPLYLTPVSFEAIYLAEMKRLQSEKEKTAAAS